MKPRALNNAQVVLFGCILAIASCGPQSSAVDPVEPHTELQRKLPRPPPPLPTAPVKAHYALIETLTATPVDEQERTPEKGDGHLSVQSSVSRGSRLATPNDVTAEPLSKEARAALLARLPEWAEQDPAQRFAFRQSTLKAPITGADLLTPFPPAESLPPPPQAAPSNEPLRILRAMPSGEVGINEFVHIGFSQPMVALSDLDSSNQTIPATITPLVQGEWSWTDPRTLSFRSEGGLPMATEYVVSVPAGTRSALGNALAEDFELRFATPPISLVAHLPDKYTPTSTQPLLLLEFDQQIDPDALLPFIQLSANGKNYPCERVEVLTDEVLSEYWTPTEGRWLALRPLRPLPTSTECKLTVKSGAPSAEGPRTSQREFDFIFNTYGDFRITERNCGWGECFPGELNYELVLSNNLAETFQDDGALDSLVRVEPLPKNLDVHGSWDSISIGGHFEPKTKYVISVDKAVEDEFGQKLSGNRRFSFTTADARVIPAVYPDNDSTWIADPFGAPTFEFYSVGLPKVHSWIFAVDPKDYLDFKNNWLPTYRRDANARTSLLENFPGRLIAHQEHPFTQRKNEAQLTRLDLSPALHEGHGQVLVLLEGERPTDIDEQDWWLVHSSSWIQFTDLGMTVLRDQDGAQVFMSSLATGEALSSVEGSNEGGFQFGFSDSRGVLSWDPSGDLLIARKGNDVAFLHSRQIAMSPRAHDWTHRWFFFDDRQLYRPGETVTIKGWLRALDLRKQGDLALAQVGEQKAQWTAFDPRGAKLANGEAELSALGGFDFQFTIPDGANLGTAHIELRVEGLPGDNPTGAHWIRIEEFRRPEFEVGIELPAGPHFVGDKTEAQLQASYYAGGGLGNAEVEWHISSHPASYTPPQREDFSFGEASSRSPYRHYAYFVGYQGQRSYTDPDGVASLQLEFSAIEPALPRVLDIEGVVTDVNRQQWASSSSVLVHPSRALLGLRSGTSFVDVGQPIEIDTIVSDVDGTLLNGRDFELRALRQEWRRDAGDWDLVEVESQVCAGRSADGIVRCVFPVSIAGSYVIRGTVTDAEGRLSQSSLSIWVAGEDSIPQFGGTELEADALLLTPDKDFYQAGDTARILLSTQNYPSHGLMTVLRSGILSQQSFELTSASHVLEVPILEEHVPNLAVWVELVGTGPRQNSEGELDPKLPPRPSFSSASVNLSVPPLQRRLSVMLSPHQKELQPGQSSSLDVMVYDSQGQAVADAEVALVMVDEAVLALAEYELGDPIATMYRPRDAEARVYHNRSEVLLALPEFLPDFTVMEDGDGFGIGAMGSTGRGGGVGEAKGSLGARGKKQPKKPGDAAEQTPLKMRKDFDPLAHFESKAQTDASGHAQLDFTLPDNLTRYRIMAVAVAGAKHFGTAESSLTARLELMLRPSAPRFLNFGDTFELPVVVQNLGEGPRQVQLAVRARNAKLDALDAVLVEVPAKERIELRFPVSTQEAGKAVFQFAMASDELGDAAELSIPVWTPATSESFAIYGELDEGAVVQPIKPPKDAIPAFGGLELSTSSTALSALTDAVIYLVEYPYECSEQLASRILGIVSLQDVLAAFEAPGLPSADALRSALTRDLERLAKRQLPNGGLGFWYEHHHPYVSIHVAHATRRAMNKGVSAPEELVKGLDRYLRDLDNNIKDYERRMGFTLDERSRASLQLYGLYVRSLGGEKLGAQADLILQRVGLDKLSLESMGWMLAVLARDGGYSTQRAEILRELGNHTEEGAATANFVSAYEQGELVLLASNRRTDAVILDALIEADPQSTLIPKVVRGLLAHRKKGAWSNTQENAFVLVALERYFSRYEANTPDFVARMWLGEDYAGEQLFEGRSTDRQHLLIPMDVVMDGGERSLVLQKEGTGRLYYRLGLRYAPSSLELEPLDRGFAVERSYQAVDDNAEVQQNEDGTWRIKLGATVRVTLKMVANNRRYHVALVDKLPAGFEAMNANLAGTPEAAGSSGSAHRRNWQYSYHWFEHENLRDERTEAFCSLLWEGEYSYSYLARATTPGDFVAPPASAEEMYSPEVFGRSASTRVVIE
ncbi:MAG: alpha-2-macroglobulin family protein [Myxococcota bacterium]|jgi:uncharacterized protein YfaS (alpha-2-macroglobulin family)|nr:alpha-2-macroglobulin family protein [Myxococcota bacterium]